MTDPDVYYVPGATNYYDHRENVIVLDEALKEYPEARDYILEHEIEHSETTSFFGTLRLEFLTDLEMRLGDSDRVRAAREYYREEKSSDGISWLGVKMESVTFLRGFWNIPLVPLSKLRGVVRRE